jgi:hypothetical protein
MSRKGRKAFLAVLALGCLVLGGAGAGEFRRGDATGDGDLDLSDGVVILFQLFESRGTLGCLDAADTDDDGEVDLSDAVRLLAHLFLGGPPLQQPADRCGVDPTPDGLGCEVDPDCAAGEPAVVIPGGGGQVDDTCTIEHALFRSAEGGCKELTPRLVWVNLSQDGGQGTWDFAANLCDTLTTGGFGDWRLPTVAELQGLASEDEFHLRILAGDFVYWSSEVKGNRAWGVFLGGASSGTSNLALKASGRFVLCVRAGSPPPCGDGFCDPGETPCSCPQDCGTCEGPICGNGVCEPGEDCGTCPGGITEPQEASDPGLCDGND